jgi:hypothetical protein
MAPLAIQQHWYLFHIYLIFLLEIVFYFIKGNILGYMGIKNQLETIVELFV